MREIDVIVAWQSNMQLPLVGHIKHSFHYYTTANMSSSLIALSPSHPVRQGPLQVIDDNNVELFERLTLPLLQRLLRLMFVCHDGRLNGTKTQAQNGSHLDKKQRNYL